MRQRPALVLAGLAGLLVWTWGIVAGPPAGGANILLLPAGAFEIVPEDSSVTFSVPDNRGGFMGRTTRITGAVTIEPQAGGETYRAQVAAVIDARSITTDNSLRDGTMRAVYLRTGEFPTITFTGTVTARPGLGIRPFPAAVQGRLTIRDVTREEAFAATVTALARDYLADVSTTVRMADYRIPYPRAFIFVARDPVTVKLHIRASPGQAHHAHRQ